LVELGYVEANDVCFKIHYDARIDTTRRLSAETWKEFLWILDRNPNPERIDIHSHWTSKKRDPVEILISVSRQEIDITVGSHDPAVQELLHRQMQESFHASNTAPEKSPILSRWSLKKTVFLAHRFDEQGKVAAAAVERFLRACGFAVVEGEGYEARNIPAKVEERIESQDILLAVFTPGDPTWTTSEAAFARGRKKYIVFLAEDGTDVKKGILGADYEHLTFPPGNVEKAFTSLLYALPR
jgi:predicted nucleotide-binding protein